jgi:hypothetical protein
LGELQILSLFCASCLSLKAISCIVRNSCTPFHMKICNSQNSFGGGTTM